MVLILSLFGSMMNSPTAASPFSVGLLQCVPYSGCYVVYAIDSLVGIFNVVLF